LCLLLAALLGGCRESGGFILFFDDQPDLWDGTIAAGFSGGSGSAADPYRIHMSTQLAYLARQVTNGTTYAGSHFILTRNLNLNGREWTTIGTNTVRFAGTFDGNNHVIHNLSINKSATSYQGLFGCLDGATIQELGLENVSITGGYYVGGVAGQVTGGSSIVNSYSTGTVSGTGYVGGVAGQVTGGGDIANSYSTGNVSGTDECVGGVAGSVTGGGGIANSYSTGDVSGIGHVGGVAGEVTGGIADSYSTGTVGGNYCVGGVAGSVASGSSIEHCAALNPWVKATTNNAGRVVGFILGGTFPGNVAWDSMSTNGGIPFTTNPDNTGTGITTTQVKDGTGLPSALKTAPWSYTPGKLPVLSGLAGQTGALPGHLQ
jgi:hypothetical protein